MKKVKKVNQTIVRLYEKYRPRSLSDLVGQNKAQRTVKLVTKRAWGGRAYWLSGDSGTGKTSLARIIAEMGAADFMINEYDSGWAFDTETLDQIDRDMHLYGMGKGGRAYIINEAHGLRRWMIQRLLGFLERIPNHVVFIFTTTKAGNKNLFDEQIDAGPLLSRCICIDLDNSARLTTAFAKYCKKIARTEHLDGRPLVEYIDLAKQTKNNCRAMLQKIESGGMMR